MNSKVVSLAWAKVANCLPLSPPATVNTELGFHLKCLFFLPQPFRKGNQHPLSFSEQSSSIRLPFCPVPQSTPSSRQSTNPLALPPTGVPNHCATTALAPASDTCFTGNLPTGCPSSSFTQSVHLPHKYQSAPPHPHPFLKGPQSAQPLPQPHASPASPVASCQ